ncbi:hypothetical protein I4U23_019060 [Adineta vaga]|nr:hypothetical protein I4U23_019060 [Adineta vaga]
MNFIAILFTISCALIAATNALQCQPVTCMLACPFGFNIDANGCQYCSCRPRPSGASTSQPAVGTSASSRRPMSRLLAIASGPSTAAPKSSTPAATTARGSTGSTRVTRPATSTQRWLSLVDPKTIYD